MKNGKQWANSRNVKERIYIEGELVLQTPAHFGNGDEQKIGSITLLYDLLDGATPILPGASIAGALRNELREREQGYYGAEYPSHPGIL